MITREQMADSAFLALRLDDFVRAETTDGHVILDALISVAAVYAATQKAPEVTWDSLKVALHDHLDARFKHYQQAIEARRPGA